MSNSFGLYDPWNSPGQNAGMGSLSLLQGDLPNPGIKSRSPTLQAVSLPAEPQGSLPNDKVLQFGALQLLFLCYSRGEKKLNFKLG